MPSNIGYLKYIFLGLMIVACTAVVGYDVLYGMPKKKCDDAHKWWSWSDRKCYTEVYLPTITGRTADKPATIDWHNDKNN
ncbi:MAG TPA: hypothetical protein VG839_09100 [Asticcacaulis sp.]|nr:hypothetical protein [Asticcacaulis sp.]